jgi:membrane dipeptidase
MSKTKKYSGYQAWQFLTPGLDYKVFPLRREIVEEWVETVPLSLNEEDRLTDLIEHHIVIDLHAHPVVGTEDVRQTNAMRREGRNVLAYHALSLSGLDCIFDNLMDGSCFINTKHGWDWMGTLHDLGMQLCDIAHQDFIIHCKRVEDILHAHATGQLAWVAVLESASCIENEVDRLDVLYGLGVRSIGINYSESNMLGSGLKESRDGGLTDFGYDTVVRMNKLGLLIDVSHTGDQTALDTITSSKTPIIISHSGARSLTPTPRMFPDEVLHTLAEHGGVIGIEAAPNLTATQKHPLHSIESYMEHIEYCINLTGINHVGCGPDTSYTDHVGRYLAALQIRSSEGLGHYSRQGNEEKTQHLGINMDVEALTKLQYVRGMENPTECVMNVARWMISHGYSDHEIAKVIGGNGLALLRKVW